MRTRDTRLPLRAWAVLLGLIGLFAQGSQAGHMLLVEHVVCAEHGELVHGDEHHGLQVFEASSREPSLRSQAGDEAAHAHEHCGTLTERRDTVSASSQAQLAFDRSDLGVVESSGAAAPKSPENPLRFAPKASPPAC
jgi:hypothetical protein